MEHIGKEPDHIYATVHAPGYSGGNGVGSNLITDAEALKSDFHVYAIEWEENEIRWYVDDQQYFKVTPEDVPAEWYFDHPFFIILNLAEEAMAGCIRIQPPCFRIPVCGLCAGLSKTLVRFFIHISLRML